MATKNKVPDLLGWGETKDATEETQRMCDQVKDEVEKKTGKNYVKFTAVKYREQCLCGGKNTVIKVHVGGDDYIHLSVHEICGVHPTHATPPSLRGVQDRKTKEDPLEPF